MLHKVKASHGEILKGLPELKRRLRTSAQKKKLLLETAANGDPRPPQRTRIGMALGNYTRRRSPVYDPEFDRKIRRRAPRWFADTAEENKRLLLRMAEEGKPKPKDKEKIGALLYLYLKKDPRFRTAVRRLAPDWLVRPSDQKKRQLLDMARKGMPKPKCPGTLARSLSNYTRRNSPCRDPDFTKNIKRLAPHWFRRGKP